MISLNTYNYQEQVSMKTVSYQVSISDNDKVIKIEEDGSLIAELAFALENNILFLNGKDGLEVAQIELPTSMAAITNQSYDAETKSIDLSILQTNGEIVVFSLDVAELVNVYTAGDGIDITENVISIKIKDQSGTLRVDEEGLDIDLDSLASSEDVTEINAKLSNLEENLNSTREYLATEIADREAADVSIKEDLVEVSTTLDAEVTAREEAVADLQAQIGDVAGSLEGSISDAIADLQTQIGDVKGELEGSISDEISKIKEEIGDVKGELEGSITDAIADLQEQIGDVKGELEGSISEEIGKIKEEITDVKEGIDETKVPWTELGEGRKAITLANHDILLGTNTKGTTAAIAMISKWDVVDLGTASLPINLNTPSGVRPTVQEAGQSGEEAYEIAYYGDVTDEAVARESGDAFLQAQLGDGFMSAANPMARALGVTVTTAVKDLQAAVEDEIVARTEKDTELETKIVEGKQELSASIDSISTFVNNSVNYLNSIDQQLNDKIEKEIADRVSGDNQSINLISTEREERKAADDELNTLIVTANEELANSIKLVKDENNNLKYTLYVNGNAAGELNIPADKMLESVVYDEEAKTLTFVWNTDIQQSPTIIDISDLVDTYLAGDGLLLEGKTFKANVGQSKYIDVNENGAIEFVGVFQKPSGTSWKYDLIGKNGLNNEKFIDFTEDYNAFDAHIKETYAPLTYVDVQDEVVKAELIGAESDAETTNTIYGLRTLVAKSEEVMTAKIAEEQARAEGVEADLANKIEVAKSDVACYVNQEIEKVNATIATNEEYNSVAHSEMSQNIKVNSEILASLTNGEGTGVVDKLDKQFHEVTKDIDENNFEGLIKSLMDRIAQLESTISVLTASSDTIGSVANVVANSLTEAKLYAKEEADSVYAKTVTDNNNLQQWVVDQKYLTEVDGVYVTETELREYNYVNQDNLTAALSNYTTTDNLVANYQPKGDYLTSVPEEFVTATELETYHYATERYVDERDGKLLARETADLLYAPKGSYVTTDELTNKGYATVLYVDTKITDMATKTWAESKFQPIGNYLTEVPQEFITEGELYSYGYATQAFVNTEISSVNSYISNNLALKLDKTEAATTYQLRGDYVTNSTLTEKDYATKTDLLNATANLSTTTYVDTEITKVLNMGYATKSELNDKASEVKSWVESQSYVSLTTLNTSIADMQTKTDAAATYLTKTDFNNYVENVAFKASHIVGGKNISTSTNGNYVTLNAVLSTSYNVVDTYNQNLPLAGQDLDTITEKLASAVKNLYDITDGEVF